MRSVPRVVLSLTSVVLLLSVCSRGGSSTQPPLALSYAASTAIYTKGVLVTANIPSSSGGAVTLYRINPALPAGLRLSSSTGIISGEPTAATAANNYTVTASNLSGSTTATLTITVIDAPPAQTLPNLGQQITPLAPPNSRFEPMNPDLPDNPAWLAGQAVTTVVSPDSKTLLVLTSGYNRVYNANGTPFKLSDSKEYVFIYDISKYTPIKKQVVQIPNTYSGIVFDPSGKAFYVSGGMGDFPFDKAGDNVHIVALGADGTWVERPGTELALGHRAGLGLAVPNDGLVPINSMVFVQPCAAGVAISNDGKTLVVANYYNDSITVFSGGLGSWSKGTELDLRPGKGDPSQAGTPGGEYPFWVVVKGTGPSATAYVSSLRDREIDVVNLGLSPKPKVTARVPVKGQPGKMTLNAAQSLLYVVEDQADTIDVIDTAKNAVLETIPVIAPAAVVPTALAQFTGANPNSVTLIAG